MLDDDCFWSQQNIKCQVKAVDADHKEISYLSKSIEQTNIKSWIQDNKSRWEYLAGWEILEIDEFVNGSLTFANIKI